jgi:DNA gyrase subunit A
MRLKQLTGLEIEKIENEYQELKLTIADLEDIIASRERRIAIVLQRLDEIADKFGDDRRTAIEDAAEDFDYEDLIAEEEQVITLSAKVMSVVFRLIHSKRRIAGVRYYRCRP